MAVWPTAGNFPQTVAYRDFQEQTPAAIIRTQMEAGPDKVRRRYTAAPRPFRAMLSLATAQVATLDSFFVTTLAYGSLPFDWVHPRTGSAGVFRFKGPITYTRLGPDLWQAKFEMELLP